MNIEDLKAIVSLFDHSSLMELHLQQEGVDLQLSKRKNYPVSGSNQVVETIEEKPVAVVPTKEIIAETVLTKAPEVQETVAKEDLQYIKSPIVGIVYLAPSPDDPAFVQVQDKVQVGQPVCIIEAMKIMNEITADFSGEVVEVLVENGQMVDYGQELFALKKI
jgi:acetyl-coA carboxylase, biotin carboxyl carrier protein